MQKITYEFNDGSTQTITVTDEFYEQYQELVRQEKRNYWRETRRHISLDNLNGSGIDLADETADTLTQYFEHEQVQARTQYLMSKLSKKQQVLFYRVYVQNLRLVEIAKMTGSTTPALCQQLATIQRKLKNFFEKP